MSGSQVCWGASASCHREIKTNNANVDDLILHFRRSPRNNCNRTSTNSAMSVTAATSPSVGSFHLCRRSTRPAGLPRFRMTVRSTAVSVTPLVTKLRKECATPLPLLRHVADAMAADMRAGLAVDGGSDLKMILSYVDSLPTG